jgi:4-hydroxybenzoate polyprenyltransferase
MLRVEAAWWMSRILLSNLPAWSMLAGWMATGPRLDGSHVTQLLALYVAIALAGGAAFVINDLMDVEGDKVTAPYLPLPSGLLSRKVAWTLVAVYLAGALIFLYLACDGVGSFLICLLVIVVSAMGAMGYCRYKKDGIVASVIVTVPQTIAPAVIGWVAAGGGPAWRLVAVLGYAVLAGVSNNIIAALRDVDLDATVGNRTLPVRIGAPAAYRRAAQLAFAALAVVIVLAATIHGGVWAWPFVAVAGGVLWWAYRRGAARFAQPERGRRQRMADLRLFKTGEYVRHAAIVAVFNPVVAIVALVYLLGGFMIGYWVYHHRLTDGTIHGAMERLTETREPV